MPGSTLDPGYAERLRRRADTPWRKLLDVQRPYRWNLRRLVLGRVLDVGCGVGRNLAALDPASIGVDHNPQCVAYAREDGFRAYRTQEFLSSPEARSGVFDSLLFAHVLEHMDERAADELLAAYLPFLKPNGKLVFITPQEAGFRIDDSHVRLVDFDGLRRHAERLKVHELRVYSFPFPRWAGRLFPYNEFVFVGTLK